MITVLATFEVTEVRSLVDFGQGWESIQRFFKIIGIVPVLFKSASIGSQPGRVSLPSSK